MQKESTVPDICVKGRNNLAYQASPYGLFPLLLAMAISIAPAAAFADERQCQHLGGMLKKSERLTEQEKGEIMTGINDLVQRGALCGKNLLGNVYYEGTILKRDVERAQAIFYDLTTKTTPLLSQSKVKSVPMLPAAAYNLLYVKINERNGNPEEIFKYLHGMMLAYLDHDLFGHLSSDSRELGWDYLDFLETTDYDKGKLKALRDQHAFFSENMNDLLVKMTYLEKEQESNQDQGDTESSAGPTFSQVMSFLDKAATVIEVVSLFTPRRSSPSVSNSWQSNAPDLKSLPLAKSPSMATSNLRLVIPTGAPNTVMLQQISPFGSFFSPQKLYQVIPSGNPNLIYLNPLR